MSQRSILDGLRSIGQLTIKMIVKFLKMVYTGILRYCNAFEPVQMVRTSRTEMGAQFFASFQLKGRSSIQPILFAEMTHTTPTRD